MLRPFSTLTIFYDFPAANKSLRIRDRHLAVLRELMRAETLRSRLSPSAHRHTKVHKKNCALSQQVDRRVASFLCKFNLYLLESINEGSEVTKTIPIKSLQPQMNFYVLQQAIIICVKLIKL